MPRWLVVAIGIVAIGVTVLPMLPSNELWIRVWDFPRLQIAACLALALVGCLWLLPWRRRAVQALLALLVLSLAWQLHRIWPFTPLVAVQAKTVAHCEEASRVRLMVANVLVDNRDAAPLLAIVEAVEPDLLLLVETDAWWDEAIAPLIDAYPYSILHPRENSYGMHLFSRFETVEPRLRFLVERAVPSIKTGLRLPSGALIDFYGVHPKPPPLADTEERDAELLLVAQEVRDEGAPAIVAGDLNDVAWSDANRLFQDVSGLLDPRVGRGPYSTFNADWPLMRWPLDHVFFEQSFFLMGLDVLGDIGSDHFPFFIALCHAPEAAAEKDAPDAEPADREAADEAIEEGREDGD